MVFRNEPYSTDTIKGSSVAIAMVELHTFRDEMFLKEVEDHLKKRVPVYINGTTLRKSDENYCDDA